MMRLALVLALGLPVFASCRAAEKLLGFPGTKGFDLAIVGNDALTNRALAQAIRLDLEDWREAGFSDAYADDAAFALNQHYISQGYAFAQVEFTIEDLGTKSKLVFHVNEGPLTLVEDFSFPGFESTDDLDREDLADFYSAPRLGLAGGGPPVFVESKVRSLRSTLLSELRARGHLDVSAGEPEIAFEVDRQRARVTLALRPGPKYLVRAATLDGDLPPDLELQAAADSVARETGQPKPFSPNLVPELRGRLLAMLRNAGYPDAQVDVRAQIEQAPPAVALLAAVSAGQQVRVGEILVEGRTPGHEGFVTRRMLINQGELAREDKIRASVSRLYRSGLFRRVETELRGTGEVRDLAVIVDQRPSRELFIEPGYGSYELFRLRTGARELDLWGTGRGLRTELTAAVRAQHALIGLTDPEILGPRDSLDLAVDYDRREQPSFTSVSRGFGAFITHDWNPSGRRATTYGYQYRQSDLEDVDVITTEVQEAIDDLQLSGLRASHIDDQRDLPLFPRKGTLLEVSTEWGDASFGSGLDYVRLTLATAAYLPWGEDRVLAVGLRTGTIRTTDGSQTVPIQERFFLGGENSVRSYRESELGPTDSADNAIGGEAFTLGSIELRQDLGFTPWQLAGFVDMGNVSPDTSDILDFDDYGWAVGVGLRYVLPVGPIRLDLGWNPDSTQNEDTVVLHLAVGLAF